jgi:hypothetical protein
MLENVQHLEDNSDAQSSTQDPSEFVDATQIISDDVNIPDAPVLHSPPHDGGKSRVQDDMQFLKESWANMAENEDDETSLPAALDKGPSPPGFQMVVSKARKFKSKSSKISSQQGRYETRSKVDKPKTSR